jgi:hypothetical protein
LRTAAIVVEPEDLLHDNVSSVDDEWDVGARAWMDRLFPRSLDGLSLTELLWTNMFRQPNLFHRKHELVLALEVVENLRPRSITFLGALPHHCGLIRAAAEDRQIAVSPTASLGIRLLQGLNRPKGLLLSPAYFFYNAWQALRGTLRRRATDRALRQQSRDTREAATWFAVSPSWLRPSRHILDGAATPLAARGIPFGLLFLLNYGSSGARDELSLLDGSEIDCVPSAAAQVVGASNIRSLIQLLLTWSPVAIRGCAAAIRHFDDFSLRGIRVMRPNDLGSIIRICTSDLLRIIDAKFAAERWLAKCPSARVVVFSFAASGEAKAVDLVLQRSGVRTVDVPHGYAYEGNLRSDFRSVSTYRLAWTEEQAARVRALSTNEVVVGGFMPWKRQAAKPRCTGAVRVLIVSNYCWEDVWGHNLKYSRRLAEAVKALQVAFGPRIQLRVRLHPLEDRATWERHFAPGESPPVSTRAYLGEDLANTDILVSSISSAILEGLLYDIPVLVHRSVIFDPETIFRHIAPARWFGDGAELVGKIRHLIERGIDLEPERELKGLCFSTRTTPRDLLSFFEELDASAGKQPIVADLTDSSNRRTDRR